MVNMALIGTFFDPFAVIALLETGMYLVELGLN